MQQKSNDEQPMHFQNGQSDAERLMREHLRTPDHKISEEELTNLKVGITPEVAQQAAKVADEAVKNDPANEDKGQASSWDVLGG